MYHDTVIVLFHLHQAIGKVGRYILTGGRLVYIYSRAMVARIVTETTWKTTVREKQLTESISLGSLCYLTNMEVHFCTLHSQREVSDVGRFPHFLRLDQSSHLIMLNTTHSISRWGIHAYTINLHSSSYNRSRKKDPGLTQSILDNFKIEHFSIFPP